MEQNNLTIEQRSDFPPGLNGLIIGKKILINKNLNRVDKGYILAHELSHYLLHKGNTLESNEYEKIEQQANEGAIKLLLAFGIDE